MKLELPPAIPVKFWRLWDALIWVLIAGLALVRFCCWRLGISKWMEGFLYLTLAFTAGLSTLVLAALGLLDTWFDWRRLDPPSQEAAAEQDRQQNV